MGVTVAKQKSLGKTAKNLKTASCTICIEAFPVKNLVTGIDCQHVYCKDCLLKKIAEGAVKADGIVC
jgi:hypothetical protein